MGDAWKKNNEKHFEHVLIYSQRVMSLCFLRQLTATFQEEEEEEETIAVIK